MLINEVAPDPSDRIYLLGDLVNGGPDSAAVVRWARARKNCQCIVGNHELRLLRWKLGGDPSALKNGDTETAGALNEADWRFLAGMPLTLEITEHKTLLVHGGFAPGKPWAKQPPEVVTRIQVIDPEGKPAKRSEAPGDAPSWADFWTGPPFVVYGHTPRQDVFRRRWSLGLDTGCVYGGKLSALVLPGHRLVQVKARKAYKER